MSDNPILEPETSEVEQTPTTEPEAKADQVTPEGSDNLEKPVEPKEGAAEDQKADEEKVIQYLELDGKEYDLEDVRTWKNGHMMQSDYTKKTTEHARQREKDLGEIKVDREKLTQAQSEVTALQDQLKALVSEDEEINWVELKEDDPERYIELKERADKRKATIEDIKAERQTPIDDPALIQVEQGKLLNANPDWLDKDNNFTDTYKADIQLMNEYAVKAGYDMDEYSKTVQSHKMVTILKAAKYDQLQEKGREIKEKREKVPVVTKPKVKVKNNQPKTAAEVWFPNVS